jgi:hypothetical protein
VNILAIFSAAYFVILADNSATAAKLVNGFISIGFDKE